MEALLTNVPFSPAVMNMFRDAVVVTDAQGIILQVNQAYQDISGYHEDELIGQPPAKIKSGRHSKVFYESMWHALTTHGVWEGEIWDRRKNAEVYPKWLKIQAVRNDEGEITHYVGVFHETSNSSPSFHEKERLANIDPLTGLYNRHCYREFLARMIRTVAPNDRLVQLYLDIDRFKEINERYGYVVGDDLIAILAERIRIVWHEINDALLYPIQRDQEQLIGRFSGDEFLMAFRFDAREDIDLNQLLERLSATLSEPYKIRGHIIKVSCSIGTAQLNVDANDDDELISHAESAMYIAKQTGGDRSMIFTQSIQEQIERRKLIQQSLLQAVEDQEFELYYQPKIGGLSRRVCGYEALVRWNHPTLGMLSPVEFIPIAEESGAILPLGDWIFENACRYAKSLNDIGLIDLPVAINVSAIQLSDPSWLDRLMLTIDKVQLPPHLIELELTESQLLTDIENSTDIINYIRSRGIKVALDDFGTGYSSLSYLRNLPLDTLKIDRSFVSHLQEDQENYDLAIIKAVTTLAKQLGMALVAEGVEQATQERILRDIGCDQLQGYLYSKPIPAEEFLELCLKGLIHKQQE
ncbi:Cyclic di-GMP phosphodiesterase Gmr [Marinomonas aquimarina]|uniref:Cyclic di-GMP phosphodiesterase Gmr n=1 Tax=Marinomonas aquimarina TaxID=295068 RepID=A0A1A8TGK2_9GAMM|nr:GGDEF domain-containing phosphodiesterase [Marinomonas aquimarina]SBS32600.1 Cyclic di-GMP phosphodiesterase Gmr [Marinomonas aquimarina]